ncbi:mRNA-decapping enzyme subunit 2 [Tulasnella sp. JGI-2019a]|nr:mRNA-decapping enzyme subunit 2 [Tulasnella sp. JGI-2019a]
MDPTAHSIPLDTSSQTPDPPRGTTRKKPPLEPPSLPTSAFSFKDATMDLILEDLSSRFILNLPDNELASVERVCFQVEQAHWYYEDFIRPENHALPTMALRIFSAKLFAACPLLQRWSHRHEEAFDDFLKYKTSVPVCGGILLNSTWDKCVLVKGYKSGSPWGFPRGKINENEPLHECAAREVLEETGYNCRDQIREDISITLLGKDHQLVSLYLVPGVPEDYPFLTRTRKEISKIEWFSLNKLPGYGFADDDDGRYPSHKGTSQNDKTIRTWGISPFLKQLKNRLFHFQVAFGYVPPNLAPHELRDYKRIQKQAARSVTHQHGHRTKQATPIVQREELAVGDSAAGDSESTGAEGDEEPELDTDYDHEPANGGKDVGVPHHHKDTSRQGASAIDALFKKTGASALYNTDGYSSPDVAGQPAAARKATKAPKRKSSRTRISSSHVVVGEQQPPTVNATDPSDDKERAHLTNLLQSLAISSGAIGMASGSGLPTPAESPVVVTHKATVPVTLRNGVSAQGMEMTHTNGTASESPVDPHPSQTTKPMFEFISPFDALSPVVAKKIKEPAKAPITILRRQSVHTSTSASSSSLVHPATLRSSSGMSASTPGTAGTSGSEDRPSISGSENMGDISSFSADEMFETTGRHSVASDLTHHPLPEAPSTMNFGLSSSSSMMARGASNITATQLRMGSPENMSTMTPRARLGSFAPSYTNGERPPAPLHSSVVTRSTSLASNGPTSSAQHMALLDMVATEAEVIALSTCPTPQGLQGGVMLPPVNEGSHWNDANGAGVVVGSSISTAAPARDMLRGDVGGRSTYQSGMTGPPPLPLPGGYPINGDFYPPYPNNQQSANFGTQPFPPQQFQHPHPPYPQSHRPALPPHLHHPHPLLHPHHNIRIPSASPTPHRLPSQPTPSAQSDNYDTSNPVVSNMNGTTPHPNVLYNTSDITMSQPRKLMASNPPPNHLSTVGSRMMETMHGSGAGLAPIPPPNNLSNVGSRMMEVMHGPGAGQALNPVQPRIPASFVNGNPPNQGRPAPGIVSPILSRLPRPLSGVGFNNPYPVNGGPNFSEQVNLPPAQVSSPYLGLQSSVPPPDPSSFVVQKSQTDRAELLNFLRSTSMQTPEKNVTSPLNADSRASGSSLVSSATRAAKRPSMVFESGLVPANVQYRALAKAAFSGGQASPPNP